MTWTQDRLETDHLVLRALSNEDKPLLASLYSDADVRRYLGGPVEASVLEAIREADIGFQWGSFCITLVKTGTAMGTCSFGRDRGELEISYQLLPRWTGRGYGTEAVSAAVGWAWENTDDASIIAVTQTANEWSLALLQRIGFVEESRFEEFGAEHSLLRVHRGVTNAIGV